MSLLFGSHTPQEYSFNISDILDMYSFDLIIDQCNQGEPPKRLLNTYMKFHSVYAGENTIKKLLRDLFTFSEITPEVSRFIKDENKEAVNNVYEEIQSIKSEISTLKGMIENQLQRVTFDKDTDQAEIHTLMNTIVQIVFEMPIHTSERMNFLIRNSISNIAHKYRDGQYTTKEEISGILSI